uniref:Uncharacterized protein n=1 Tax=Alexandrium catenella TaxID=2925 RepID=A0A7S1Q618_ALECA|mmetsp:Transcript_18330/g.49787  ORF Transcript_18330/g.49787 Transcript_18330/m.49787 type:complete len:193 (+) Transcript_18330:307-885(+)
MGAAAGDSIAAAASGPLAPFLRRSSARLVLPWVFPSSQSTMNVPSPLTTAMVAANQVSVLPHRASTASPARYCAASPASALAICLEIGSTGAAKAGLAAAVATAELPLLDGTPLTGAAAATFSEVPVGEHASTEGERAADAELGAEVGDCSACDDELANTGLADAAEVGDRKAAAGTPSGRTVLGVAAADRC